MIISPLNEIIINTKDIESHYIYGSNLNVLIIARDDIIAASCLWKLVVY